MNTATTGARDDWRFITVNDARAILLARVDGVARYGWQGTDADAFKEAVIDELRMREQRDVIDAGRIQIVDA